MACLLTGHIVLHVLSQKPCPALGPSYHLSSCVRLFLLSLGSLVDAEEGSSVRQIRIACGCLVRLRALRVFVLAVLVRFRLTSAGHTAYS